MQNKHNIIHSKTRRIVERTLSVWKRQFPSLLRGLTNTLICSTSIVMACAVLHNLSLYYDNILPENRELYFYAREQENSRSRISHTLTRERGTRRIKGAQHQIDKHRTLYSDNYTESDRARPHS